ncbi:acetyl-CoA carboxylase biotin carboxyl carrier protein [Crocinitomicaceae bacterium]|jgi:acetyl-CoA carboxylase biotin carboxyl carrier protein|nr:acetyl-CoA carboxylase biotin carboxyl carrier protein [Crocinitomicaceae bacterium]MDG1347560.1 acetyl-CoA carboxylase biotin carboxyl carrier protein [Crocinitomicaceae bacterium]MDG2464684.1 acetyl-CoA carboxylase biotin carboxyl carrier protein [Crocinitomicaceae bacterium]
MNIQEIQDLIKFVAKSQVSEVEIEKKDFKITIKSEMKSKGGGNDQPIIVQAAAPAPLAIPAAAPVTAVAPAVAAPEVASNLIEIKSPMIGTFYRSSGPDKDLFVNVGDTIGVGDTVCIIEAMKLFNEIEAEVTGKIVKVLVDDATPVEYDQPLFLVEPA